MREIVLTPTQERVYLAAAAQGPSFAGVFKVPNVDRPTRVLRDLADKLGLIDLTILGRRKRLGGWWVSFTVLVDPADVRIVRKASRSMYDGTDGEEDEPAILLPTEDPWKGLRGKTFEDHPRAPEREPLYRHGYHQRAS